jgi:hypothetical protein
MPFNEESLNGTVKSVLKALMTRELAQSFTLTGMTHGRKKGKVAFIKHASYDLLIGENVLSSIYICQINCYLTYFIFKMFNNNF